MVEFHRITAQQIVETRHIECLMVFPKPDKFWVYREDFSGDLVFVKEAA